MKVLYLILCLSVSIVYVTGCATVTTGKYQEIPVTSNPTGATVKTDSGQQIITPGKLNLERNAKHFVTATYPSYKPIEKTLLNKTQGWFWGNLLLGGVIGGIVDISSGACDELTPKKLHFEFTEHDVISTKVVADMPMQIVESTPIRQCERCGRSMISSEASFRCTNMKVCAGCYSKCK